MKVHKLSKVALLGAIAGVALTQQASASLQFQFDDTVNGGAPSSTPPYATATFSNNGSGSVLLTITASLSNAGEYISALAFNLKSSYSLSNLGISYDNSGETPQLVTVSKGSNAKQIDGTGAFDVLLQWDTANSPQPYGDNGWKRLDGTDLDYITLTLTGLTEDAFNTTDANGYYAAIKVQGNGLSSVDVSTNAITSSVPEPSTVVAGALLLLPFGISTARILRKNRVK